MTTHERAERFRTWLNSDRVFTDTGHDLKWSDHPTTTGTIGALVGHLDRICHGERHLFLAYCFDVRSSKDLTVRQRNALLAWLAPRCFKATDSIPADYETPDLDAAHDPERGWWLTRRQCAVTAAAVTLAARVGAGQAEFIWTETTRETEKA